MKRNLYLFAIANLLGAALYLPLVQAQTTPSLSPDQLHTFENLADQVKAALERGDLDAANRLASDLMIGIFKQRQSQEPTPQEKYAKLQQSAPLNGPGRFYGLEQLAKAAYNAGDLNRAEEYARELLLGTPKDGNYGNNVYYGNMVIGRVALNRDKNIPLAKSSLLASAQTPGSPQLNSFGPSMSLAKELLAVGERETVLEFFNLCRTFWKMQRGKLDDWTAMVKGGGTPNFGANLLY